MNINFDDIEIMSPDDGGGSVFYYNNLPFTGTILEYSNGVLVGEITVVDGSTNGRVALYYNNGSIKEEYFQSYNRPFGIYKSWDENGNLFEEQDFGDEYPSLARASRSRK